MKPVRINGNVRLRLLLAAALALLPVAQAQGQQDARSQDLPAARIDVEGVNQAIDKAKAFLYSKQKADGTWELSAAPQPKESERVPGQSDVVGQWGGRTAIVVYALLAAGEDAREPKLEKAIQFLKTADLSGVYAVGVRLMALSYLPVDDEVRATAARDADLLLRSVKTEGEAAGHYDYNINIRADNKTYSHSRSQYGVLGMWAAARMGCEVDPRYWPLVDAGWRRNQKETGGWNYNDYSPGEQYKVESPGMTAAGVASLMITNEFLLGDKAAGCSGNLEDRAVEAGLEWLAANFQKLDPDEHFRDIWTYITLYNVERLSVAGGLRYIGEHDWYALGAGWLLDKQRKDGSWRRSGSGGGSEQVEIVDTAFALLFLGRGRAPLLAAKLAHVSSDPRGRERKADWNQRPRDLANLAEFTGEGLERELHWQVLTPERAVEEWLDAPILYLSGSTALSLTDETKAKLKRYVELGGLIVFNADCGKQPFAASAMKLGEELFDGYEFRVLGQDHAIYNMQYPLGRGRAPRVQALSNGARELMILVPSQDLGRSWQTRKDETALQLGANIYAYAIDRSHMRYKADRYLVEKDPAARPNRRATVGRMHYDGNWNPEPGGWERLAAVLNNEYDVVLETRTVNPASDDLEGVNVLHLTGTADFELSTEAREGVKRFIENGGTLLVDAAGGSSAFAAAADRELRLIFEDAAAALEAPLPADHNLFADREGLPPLKIEYRLDAISALGASREPRLRGIERDGRLAVIYSPHDLSVGLVGNQVAGVVGYAPDTATAIVARVVRDCAE